MNLPQPKQPSQSQLEDAMLHFETAMPVERFENRGTQRRSGEEADLVKKIKVGAGVLAAAGVVAGASVTAVELPGGHNPLDLQAGHAAPPAPGSFAYNAAERAELTYNDANGEQQKVHVLMPEQQPDVVNTGIGSNGQIVTTK